MNNFYKDKQQIINWLDKYDIKNYTLMPDEQYGFVIDVNGSVDLSHKELINIPVKFNEVSGDFHCHINKLTSLEFSPQTVCGNFLCNHNKLTSLEFCPQTVSDSFDCHNNPELKEIQKITDFKLIYLEHKKILATNLSDKLNDDLIDDNSKKTARIKI